MIFKKEHPLTGVLFFSNQNFVLIIIHDDYYINEI